MPPTKKRDSARLCLSSKRGSTRSMLGRGTTYERKWSSVKQRRVRAARFCSSHCRSTSNRSESICGLERLKLPLLPPPQTSIMSKSSRVEVGLVERDEAICLWILMLKKEQSALQKQRSEGGANEDKINGLILSFWMERMSTAGGGGIYSCTKRILF